MEPIFSYETFPFPADFAATGAELPLSWEGILPDDLPDIESILHLQITPTFRQKELTAEGIAEIALLYADEAGEVRHFTARTPFAKSLKAQAPPDTLWQVDVAVESPKVRLINSRRVEVSAILVFSATGFGPQPATFISATAEPCLQCRFLPQKAAVLQARAEESWVEEGRFRLEAEDLLSLPDTQAYIRIEERKSAEGKCFVRGQIHLELLVRRVEKPLDVLTFDLPFAKMIECENWSDEGETLSALSLNRLSVTLPEGESPLLLVEAELRLALWQVQNRSIPCLSDLYATDRAAEGKSQTLSIPLCLGAVSETARWEESLKTEGKILACLGKVISFEAENREGSLFLHGQAALRLYLQGEGIGVVTRTLNFEMPLTLPKSRDAHFVGEVRLLSCKAEEGGRVILNLSAEGLVLAGQERRVITAATLADVPEEGGEKPLIFCRLSSGADLWQLAKAHRVPLDALQKENGLTGESLETDGWVLIC